MNTKHSLLFLLIFFFVFTVSAIHAETPGEKIAPFLKENTLFLAHVDLKKIDLDDVFKQIEPRFQVLTVTMAHLGDEDLDDDDLEEVAKEAKKELAGQKKEYKKILNAFLEADINEIFVLSVLELMDDYPLVIAVPGDIEIDDDMKEALDELELLPVGSEEDDWTFFIAYGDKMPNKSKSKQKLVRDFSKKFNALDVAERPEIIEALEIQSKSPVKCVYAPSEAILTLLQAMLPLMLENSPVSVEDDAIVSLLATTEYVSLGLNPAKLQMNLTARFVDDEVAEAAEEFFGAVFKESLKTDDDQWKEVFKLLKPAMKDLTPKAKGNRLILNVTEKTVEKHEENLIAALVSAYLLSQADEEEEDE